MSQRVIESIRNLCLNVFCVGWHLAVTANHSRKCVLCELAAVLDINKSNAAGNSKRLYTPGLHLQIFRKIDANFSKIDRAVFDLSLLLYFSSSWHLH